MSKELRLSADVTLPVELAGRRTAVFGISGSGKSNTATVLLEQLLARGEQIVLIDPKGEGWGLLSWANGKPSNLPVIVFGEPNGHIETLGESHGPRLADFVVESGRSVVVSLLGFESDQSERRFVATFLRQLYRRKSRQGQPTRTLVVLEEAHLFVPENVRGDAAELAGAVQRIARQGRSFGLGTLLVDQRPQDVSKRVISQCDTLICHQLVHKTDRDALREWVRGYDVDGRGEDFLSSLAQLREGEAWVWSPAWLKVFQRTRVDRRKTFDSGAAPDGSDAARSVRRAEVDLDALRGQLAEVVEKAKADDPKELRRRIADLERQVAAKPAPAKPEIRTVDVPVVKDAHLARLEASLTRAEKISEKLTVPLEQLQQVAANARAAAQEIRTAIAAAKAPVPLQRAAEARFAPRLEPRVRAASPSRAPSSGGEGVRLPPGERATLTAAAQFEGITRSELTVLTGYKRSSRDAYIQRLREKCYLKVAGDGVTPTAEGLAALGDFEPLPTGSALLAWWRERLPEGERRCLDVLAAAFPDAIPRTAIDDATGYQRSSRDAYLQRMKSKRLVEDAGRGMVRASSALFDSATT